MPIPALYTLDYLTQLRRHGPFERRLYLERIWLDDVDWRSFTFAAGFLGFAVAAPLDAALRMPRLHLLH